LARAEKSRMIAMLPADALAREILRCAQDEGKIIPSF
jgi:hypothetical protein